MKIYRIKESPNFIHVFFFFWYGWLVLGVSVQFYMIEQLRQDLRFNVAANFVQNCSIMYKLQSENNRDEFIIIFFTLAQYKHSRIELPCSQ